MTVTASTLVSKTNGKTDSHSAIFYILRCLFNAVLTGVGLTAPEEFLFGEVAGDGYHQQGVDKASDDAPER